MSWDIVPLLTREFDYFRRQQDLFSDWLKFFDDDWRMMDFEASRQRFDRELERVRNEMHRMDVQPIKLDIEQPFVTDPEGNRKLSLRFDCSAFKPDEITVKTMENRVNVHAKHVQEDKGRKVYKEFTREYTLPENVDPKKLKCNLSADGVLQLEAPAPPRVEAPKEHLIPIEHLGSGEQKK